MTLEFVSMSSSKAGAGKLRSDTVRQVRPPVLWYVALQILHSIIVVPVSTHFTGGGVDGLCWSTTSRKVLVVVISTSVPGC